MFEKKDSNPKDALGVKKVPLHVVPVRPLLEVGLAMLEGGRKYGTHNYREIGVCMSTYYNAAMRHLMAWWEGEDIDPDSGIHHVVKAMASLFVVRDGMHMGNCVDDRPIRYPGGINMNEFNRLTADIITKYPKCETPFTHTNHVQGLKPQPGDTIFVELRTGMSEILRIAVERSLGIGMIVKIVDEGAGDRYVTSIGGNNYNLYIDELTVLKRKGM